MKKYFGILVLSLVFVLNGCMPRTLDMTATPTAFPAIATATAKANVAAPPPPIATAPGPVDTAGDGEGHEPSSTVGFMPDGRPFQGNPKATIIVEEFSSYQCPFCTRYVQESYPRIQEEYIKTGLILYLFRDYPLPGQTQSPLAAEAARCAGDVGGAENYWVMHDYLFLNQSAWSGKNKATEVFKAQARKMELDSDAFAQCLDDQVFSQDVAADSEEGNQRGVRGTPTFFINGRPLVGAQPFEAFAEVIDPLIAEGGGAVVERPTPTVFPTPTPAFIDIAGETRTMGDPDAAVTIVEYSDYQCPFCARHVSQTWPDIKANFVDTGRVFYIFKDLPLVSIHPQAVTAHEAARCAGDQGHYWEMHALLFERQGAWSEPAADLVSIFVDMAVDLGLDAETFRVCAESGRWTAAVNADMQEARQLGLSGTPGFFINGYPISGAREYALFEFAIQLAEEGTLGSAYAPQE